jgi:hypothetical protein
VSAANRPLLHLEPLVFVDDLERAEGNAELDTVLALEAVRYPPRVLALATSAIFEVA